MDDFWKNEIIAAFEALGIQGCANSMPPALIGEEMHERAKDLPEFKNADLRNVVGFSLYRTFLYTVVRTVKPDLIIETGVLNGFSTTFILQALEENGHGKLVSIDYPHNDGEYEDQGTFLLPKGMAPGWSIPDRLKSRHELALGKSEELLPRIIDQHGAPDIFLHDSDHRYHHMMMEISYAWSRMEHGLILSDNVEQNTAFQDFAKGVGAKNAIVSSYKTDERLWQHGIMRK